MSPHSRFLMALSVALGTAAACSSASSLPPELGNCVKTGDASCSPPVSSSGGSSGPGGGDAGTGEGAVSSEGGSCGSAPTFLQATNTTCVPCVEGTSGSGDLGCCQASAECSALSGCLTLLQCMLGCGASNTTCQDGCEGSVSASVIGAYNSLASCVTTTCPTPECPTLPQGGTADF